MAAPEGDAAAAESEGGDGGDEEALRRLEALVTELYRFRDTLTPRDPGRDPTDPSNDPADPGDDPLVAEMEKTLKLMEEIQVSPEGRGRALVLRARALGVAPEAGAARAELALGHALKLDPALGAAWRQLGEQRWRRGDLRGARDAFGGALQQGEDPEARRLLSMALRAQGAGPGPRGEGPGPGGGALRESLAQAEAAVRCDPSDGRSWYVLGNAHVSLFFAGGQSPNSARRALAAYAQAERVDPAAAANPDLHLNRATLLQYLERFQAALEGLSRAAELAPGWDEPRKRHGNLLEFLSRLCALLANRGKLRGKRRRGLAGPVPLPLLGPLGGAGGPRPSPIAGLRPGPNPQRVLLGRVLFSLAPPGGVPYAVGLQDGAGAGGSAHRVQRRARLGRQRGRRAGRGRAAADSAPAPAPGTDLLLPGHPRLVPAVPGGQWEAPARLRPGPAPPGAVQSQRAARGGHTPQRPLNTPPPALGEFGEIKEFFGIPEW